MTTVCVLTSNPVCVLDPKLVCVLVFVIGCSGSPCYFVCDMLYASMVVEDPVFLTRHMMGCPQELGLAPVEDGKKLVQSLLLNRTIFQRMTFCQGNCHLHHRHSASLNLREYLLGMFTVGTCALGTVRNVV